ncbi:MAG: hypothetical protein K2P44_07570 [Lachnospiraceae bacterium]|nr:hypothetical protein [Lachnospiraceae bacterium]
MKEIKRNVDLSDSNFDRFRTAMVEVRFSNARSDIENSNVSAQEYKILSLNLMDEVTKENGDSKNSVSNIVEKWVTRLGPQYWQDDLVDFCQSKSDIVMAYEVRKDNDQAFIIVMDDSTIDENVLLYNDFGFDMLKKYADINDFMVLDVITGSGIEYMFDEVNIIYKRG